MSTLNCYVVSNIDYKLLYFSCSSYSKVTGNI